MSLFKSLNFGHQRGFLYSAMVALLVVSSCSTTSSKEAAAGCAATDTTRTGANFSSESGGFLLGNTGEQPGAALLEEPDLLWSLPIAKRYSDMQFDGDEIYITVGSDSASREVKVIDRFTGSELWRLPLEETDYTPSIIEGLLLLPHKSGTLYALRLPESPASPSLHHVWSTKIGARLGPVIKSSDTLYHMTGDLERGPDEVTAIDAASGEILWQTELPRVGDIYQYSVFGKFSVGEGGVYVESQIGRIIGISAATGNICWDNSVEDYDLPFDSPSIADSSVIATTGSAIASFDFLTGERSWKNDGASHSSGVAVSPDGFVYVGMKDGSLRAVGLRSGDTKWTMETGAFGETSPSVADGVVYAPSADGSLYAVDGTTGRVLWMLETGELSGRPVLLGGNLYVIADGELRAYGRN